ncbi:MAG: MiaB/RimO family radical SAM methylthiotransferase [Elusimicrobiaceae bacterium]|jgi:threonylcarbamoyladenosine tRNA methylthiotransferase MtaB|nr:MiaB/RimO family radical SAM methylthiotransferase [Elusimicrobiaceae bacterium]MBT3954755.1 MiaB/RimO family radical SAM methylthiotransferase [Elusimicrobiaceae bacterium]MBT4008060.1 MiaB/RimO family radical SAM methylthiotransferase [Elusimicrobiaceae bacterium]MBT4402619.1 MiaB/RimO family radical SAM methylthiotransferase [Elusimicrobiaceae bacterium]MBT4439493.1 MiaB/RimO family radical SAM methylthiotransferase [Elusimicrobiaceae bacterium]
MSKVFIKTFGCRVNQTESQYFLENFEAIHNISITNNFKDANLCILNTCCVTHKAERDAKKQVRQILTQNKKAKVILTGCFANVNKKNILEEFPNIKVLSKVEISQKYFQKKPDWAVKTHKGHSRAFVKIQDGCDSFCSYCIVPFARPKKTSKPLKKAVQEIKEILKNHFAEIVLTGINIGNYKCPNSGVDLADLLLEIFKMEKQFRIRLSSIETYSITDKLIESAKAADQKFCDYFHLPLQSGSTKVLKEMNRKYDAKDYENKVNKIRKIFGKNIGIYADVICGYPTETDEDFKSSLNFIKKLKLSGLHVFSFSARNGTKAYNLKQLPASIITKRAKKLRELDKQLRQKFANNLVGTTQQVLIEKSGIGVCGNFQRVENLQISGASTSKILKNQLITIKISKSNLPTI